MERIAIAGCPVSGKTLLSESYEGNIKHTDDLIKFGWEKSSALACKWFSDLSVDVIEGVAVPRALRKWLRKNKSGKPVDRAIYLSQPYGILSGGQFRMGNGCLTVWKGILPELRRRGVIIV